MARRRATKGPCCPYRLIIGALLLGVAVLFLFGPSVNYMRAMTSTALSEQSEQMGLIGALPPGNVPSMHDASTLEFTPVAQTKLTAAAPRPAEAAARVPAEELRKPSVSPAPAGTAASAAPSASGAGAKTSAQLYGFYMHVHGHPAAVIHQVRQIKKFFPGSPIYIMSDGNMDFSPLCELEGCTFTYCPPANDRWHPWPFLRRLYDATVSLKTEFVIMLEPDNTIHGPIKRPPQHGAGGLLVKERRFAGADYVNKLARERVPSFSWSTKSMQAGLCGGAYFRAEAILDALADQNVMRLDWNMLGDKFTKEIYSSDFALQYALAARGWTIMPWEEAAQMHNDKEIPMSGRKDAAFRHYSGPVGKPTYELKLQPSDSRLAKERPARYQGKDTNCQMCYSHERYVELWGSAMCTNELPFEYSDRLIERHFPNLQTEPCIPDLTTLCEPGKMLKRYRTAATTGNPSAQMPAAAAATATAAKDGGAADSSRYGFYMHVFHSPAAVIYQVRKVKEVFPQSPIYIMGDGGMDFSPLCKQEGCTFVLCPPSNDRWHPWPFMRRLYDAAVSLKTEFVIMLEPDNTIHGPIKQPPKYDAGGLLVKDRSFAGADYVEKLSRARVSGYKWAKKNQQAGLCGGSYYRSEAILDAFSDENVAKIDWNMLGEKFTKEIYSSDFAMQYALAARGWTIMPWEEAAQMHNDKEIPLAGPKDAAFRHYSGPVGKPTYELQLQPEDRHLAKDQPEKFRGKDPNCQLCYNLDRYVALYGSTQCTNQIPFTYSKLLMERYHPELKSRPCDLTWLCEPGKKFSFR